MSTARCAGLSAPRASATRTELSAASMSSAATIESIWSSDVIDGARAPGPVGVDDQVPRRGEQPGTNRVRGQPVRVAPGTQQRLLDDVLRGRAVAPEQALHEREQHAGVLRIERAGELLVSHRCATHTKYDGADAKSAQSGEFHRSLVADGIGASPGRAGR